MKNSILLTGAMLSILAAMPASAQTVLTYNWGGVHVEPNQVIAINLRMDKAAVVTTLPVLLTLEDKNGNILYQKWTTVTNGQTMLWAAAQNIGGFGGGANAASFDYYMQSPLQIPLGPGTHALIPSIRVEVPGTASPWVDMLTPTLEVIDMAPAFHVASYGNNPHLTIAAPRQ